MSEDTKSFTNVDEYIKLFPDNVQDILKEIREIITLAAPEAEEKISYQMPSYYFYGYVVHFAAFKKHIGFYPAPSGIAAFQNELSKYKSSKGAVQFPLDQPIPSDLIHRIVKYRMNENLEASKLKNKK